MISLCQNKVIMNLIDGKFLNEETAYKNGIYENIRLEMNPKKGVLFIRHNFILLLSLLT